MKYYNLKEDINVKLNLSVNIRVISRYIYRDTQIRTPFLYQIFDTYGVTETLPSILPSTGPETQIYKDVN